MKIKQIDGDLDKQTIARVILESLTDWFGIPESREAYIAESKGRPFFCGFDEEIPVGFLYLKETGAAHRRAGRYGCSEGVSSPGNWQNAL